LSSSSSSFFKILNKVQFSNLYNALARRRLVAGSIHIITDAGIHTHPIFLKNWNALSPDLSTGYYFSILSLQYGTKLLHANASPHHRGHETDDEDDTFTVKLILISACNNNARAARAYKCKCVVRYRQNGLVVGLVVINRPVLPCAVCYGMSDISVNDASWCPSA